MKKIYMKPAMQVVMVQQQHMLCNSKSGYGSRQVTGLGDGDGTDKFFEFDDDDIDDTEYDR